MLPAFIGWKLSSRPVLHVPSLPQWKMYCVTNCTQKCLEWFTLILLCWRWFCSQGCEIFAGQQICASVSPQVRPYVTLHFMADALLFSWGCCYHFKNKHPRNFLLKQASPFQIQLYYFSWVIFNCCCILVSFTEFIKKGGRAVGKARGALLQWPSWLWSLAASLWKPWVGEMEAAPRGPGHGAGSPQPSKVCPAQPRQDPEQLGKALAVQGWRGEVAPRKSPTCL